MTLSKHDENVLLDEEPVKKELQTGSLFPSLAVAPDSVDKEAHQAQLPGHLQAETFSESSGVRGSAPVAPLSLKLESTGLTSHFSPELFERETLWSDSVAAKLREANRPDLAEPLEQCHSRQVWRICQGCHTSHPSLNHCDRFYCPMCVGRLAWHRRRRIEWWARQVKAPKHLVLTIRNTRSLTKTYVQKFKRSLSALRRCKILSGVRGGLQSLEVTNEGRGWHLHSHLLVDSPFIPADDLARTWARQVKQDFAIVKIKDCRDQSYLGEVTKYAVKGSELSSWSGTDISFFIDAFTGIRAFSTFGSLFKDNVLRQKALNDLSLPAVSCDKCGNYDFWFLNQNEYDYFSATGRLPWQHA